MLVNLAATGERMSPNDSIGSEQTVESNGNRKSARNSKEEHASRGKNVEHAEMSGGGASVPDDRVDNARTMATRWRDTTELGDEIFQRYSQFTHVGDGRFSKVYCVQRRDGVNTSWRALKKILLSSAQDGGYLPLQLWEW